MAPTKFKENKQNSVTIHAIPGRLVVLDVKFLCLGTTNYNCHIKIMIINKFLTFVRVIIINIQFIFNLYFKFFSFCNSYATLHTEKANPTTDMDFEKFDEQCQKFESYFNFNKTVDKILPHQVWKQGFYLHYNMFLVENNNWFFKF